VNLAKLLARAALSQDESRLSKTRPAAVLQQPEVRVAKLAAYAVINPGITATKLDTAAVISPASPLASKLGAAAAISQTSQDTSKLVAYAAINDMERTSKLGAALAMQQADARSSKLLAFPVLQQPQIRTSKQLPYVVLGPGGGTLTKLNAYLTISLMPNSGGAVPGTADLATGTAGTPGEYPDGAAAGAYPDGYEVIAKLAAYAVLFTPAPVTIPAIKTKVPKAPPPYGAPYPMKFTGVAVVAYTALGSAHWKVWPRRGKRRLKPITVQQRRAWDVVQQLVKAIAPEEWRRAKELSTGTTAYRRDLHISAAYGNHISWPGYGKYPSGPPPRGS
jgi:hypothetical protein